MLKHASVIITLVTATLYTLGLVFYQAYLFELNIEETQFPLTVDRVLFQGFVSATSMGATAIAYLYLTALGVITVAMVGDIILERVKDHKIAKKITSIFSVSEETKELGGFLGFSFTILKKASYLFVFFMLGLAVLVLCEKAGQESAIEFKERCKNGKNYSVTITMKNTPEKIVGYPVVCSNQQCVYLVNGKSIVVNKSDIERVLAITTKKT